MAADARVGQRLGSIELLGIIGQGGRATVYRGYCIVSRRAVAVKVMHPRFDIRRLESEYRALCQIDDPHIVRAYSYGYDPPHYVMELVEGETLAEYLRKRGGRLTEIEAIDIVRQLCQGLAAVHRVGVIHRDVTMSNVMIDHGRVVLIDLGMAKRLPRFREILGSVTPPSLRVVTTGTNAYRLHHEQTGSTRSVCEGRKLLDNYIVEHDAAPEIAAVHWTFVNLEYALDGCEPQPQLPASEPAKPAAVESPAMPTTVINLPTQDRETPAPRPRPKFTAGVVATPISSGHARLDRQAGLVG